jgi:xanthine dehydrogenase accessory factor
MGKELVEVYRTLQQGTPVIIATIIDSRGSVPRKPGSKMVVFDGGKTSGTIGGGAIEGDVIKRARIAFDMKHGDLASYDLKKNGITEGLDLICGGHMQVMLEYVTPHPDNLFLYGDACHRIENEQPFLWKALIKKQNKGIMLERSIKDIAEADTGTELNPSLHLSDDGIVFTESVLPAHTAFIVGAGHVSKEIARLTKQIGMNTQVFDDRTDFANRSRFPEANGIHLCPGYVDIFEPFKITKNSYIIIVTRGHSHDQHVLSQALDTEAGYIGMMGSRKKRDSIYGKLISEGYNQSDIARVHCPIGLPIKAETPSELAVSIAAELINHRASSILSIRG